MEGSVQYAASPGGNRAAKPIFRTQYKTQYKKTLANIARAGHRNLSPLRAHELMMLVGVVEIAARILVAVTPTIGAYIMAIWLGSVANSVQTAEPSCQFGTSIMLQARRVGSRSELARRCLL